MIYEVLTYISVTKIAGVLPLDLTLHFIIGGIITIIGLRKGLSLPAVFILLVVVAGLKELNDYFFHFRADWQEYASDFIVTFGYIFIIFLVRMIRGKSSKKKVKKVKIYTENE